MPIKCPPGTDEMYRYRKIKGGRQRIGGCGVGGRFTDVKEVKTEKKNSI